MHLASLREQGVADKSDQPPGLQGEGGRPTITYSPGDPKLRRAKSTVHNKTRFIISYEYGRIKLPIIYRLLLDSWIPAEKHRHIIFPPKNHRHETFPVVASDLRFREIDEMGSSPGYFGRNDVLCRTGQCASTNTHENDRNNAAPPQSITFSTEAPPQIDFFVFGAPKQRGHSRSKSTGHDHPI